MDFSILHISDLHRESAKPMTNGPLVDSLLNDRDRYTSASPNARSPDAIVVSGDIVYGVARDALPDDERLGQQYEEALELLNILAKKFVGGDKERVVIVPGNHDVDARQFHASLSVLKIEAGKASELVRELFGPGSAVRWSWSDLCFFEVDWSIYNRRFDAFREFYSKFYEGARTYPDDPDGQFDIFDIPDLPVTFVGFNSCHNNDLFNRAAAISPECMASVGQALREPSRFGNLAIAVWHHNTEGGPQHTDYLDAEHVQFMLDRGFSLGLHGHQHRPSSLKTHFKFGTNRSMVVVAAGTLCGRSVSSHARSYNLVELDLNTLAGRLHVREVGNDLDGIPIWCARALPSEPRSHYDFQLTPPPERRVDRGIAALARAQECMEDGDYDDAAAQLEPLASTGGMARRLLLECLVQLSVPAKIIEYFDPPRSGQEAIHLMDALWERREVERLAALLRDPAVAASDDLSVVELRDKYSRRLVNSDE